MIPPRRPLLAIVWRLALLAAAASIVLAIGVYRFDWRPFGPKRAINDDEQIKILIDQKTNPYAQPQATPTPEPTATPTPTPEPAAAVSPSPTPKPKATPSATPKPAPSPTPKPKPKPTPTPPLDQQGLEKFLQQGQ